MSLLPLLFLTAQVVPVVPVANASTPASVVNELAMKRDWTVEDSPFCKARAEANSMASFPRTLNSKVKYVKTFSYRIKNNATSERNFLEVFGTGKLAPSFPWNDGQWLARQYAAQGTPGYAYLMELQDRPKEPNAYSTVASACVTVFGLRN